MSDHQDKIDWLARLGVQSLPAPPGADPGGGSDDPPVTAAAAPGAPDGTVTLPEVTVTGDPNAAPDGTVTLPEVTVTGDPNAPPDGTVTLPEDTVTGDPNAPPDGTVTLPEITVTGDPNAPPDPGELPPANDSQPDGGDGSLQAMAGKGGGKRGAPADDLDEGEGLNRDGTVRRKPGDHGRFRGGTSKGDQDAIIDEVVKEFDLTPDEGRQLHDAIGGRNAGRDTIRQEAQDIVTARRATKPKPAEETDPAPDPAKNPEAEPAPSSRDDGSTLATLAKVAAIVAALGLAVALIPTIAAAIVDPEPVTKLALIGLTVVEIAAIAAAFGFKFDPLGDHPQA